MNNMDDISGFLESIPIATCIIKKETNTIIKCNNILLEILHLNKDTTFKVDEIIRLFDFSLDELCNEGESFFVFLKSCDVLLPYVMKFLNFKQHGQDYIVCYFSNILKNIVQHEIFIDDNPKFDLVENAFDYLQIFVFILDEDKNKILYANNMVKNFLGHSILDRSVSEVFYDLDSLESLSLKAFNIDFESIIGSRWFKISACYINSHISDKAVVLFCNDITNLKKLEDRLLLKVTTDDLTKIYNRQAGNDYLNNYLSDVAKDRTILTIAYLEINNLKSVTDSYGIKEGDLYILTVVNIVKNAIRHTDIFARMLGSEFLIIFPNCVKSVVENIMSTVVNKIEFLNTQQPQYEHSIRYAVLEVNAQNIDTSENIIKSIIESMIDKN